MVPVGSSASDDTQRYGFGPSLVDTTENEEKNKERITMWLISPQATAIYALYTTKDFDPIKLIAP